jgi:SsrA-binding protein
MATKEEPGTKAIARNRRATFDYAISDEFEAGLVLRGSEVKSLREGQADIKDSFVLVRDGEAFINGLYIAPYKFARDGGHEPERRRKLLLHAKEINRLGRQVNEKGLTIVPMSLYFKNGRVKLKIGLGKGKRQHDKRQATKERDANREIKKAEGRARKGY